MDDNLSDSTSVGTPLCEDDQAFLIFLDNEGELTGHECFAGDFGDEDDPITQPGSEGTARFFGIEPARNTAGDVVGYLAWGSTRGDGDVQVDRPESVGGGTVFTDDSRSEPKAYAVRVTLEGAPVWQRAFRSIFGLNFPDSNHRDVFSGAAALGNAGHVLVGNTRGDGFVVRVDDEKGILEWLKGIFQADHVNDVVSTRDGNFVLAGSTNSFSVGDRSSRFGAFLMKIDGDGNRLWNRGGSAGFDVGLSGFRVFGGPLLETRAFAVTEVPDGLVLAGRTDVAEWRNEYHDGTEPAESDLGERHGLLMKVTDDGEFLWGTSHPADGQLASVTKARGEGIVATGATRACPNQFSPPEADCLSTPEEDRDEAALLYKVTNDGAPPACLDTDSLCGNGVIDVECGEELDVASTGYSCGGQCGACGPTCNDLIHNGSEDGVDCFDLPADGKFSDPVPIDPNTGEKCAWCDCEDYPEHCSDGVRNCEEDLERFARGEECGGVGCDPCPELPAFTEADAEGFVNEFCIGCHGFESNPVGCAGAAKWLGATDRDCFIDQVLNGGCGMPSQRGKFTQGFSGDAEASASVLFDWVSSQQCPSDDRIQCRDFTCRTQ